MKLSERLKELRKSNNWTIEEFAEMIGVAKSTYHGYEKEHRQPSLDIINKIAEIYEVSTDYLFGRTDNPLPVHVITEEYADFVDISDDERNFVKETLASYRKHQKNSKNH